MNETQTTKEIANIYRIAETRVFEAIRIFGVPFKTRGWQVIVAKADFYKFADTHPELIGHWQDRMENPNSGPYLHQEEKLAFADTQLNR